LVMFRLAGQQVQERFMSTFADKENRDWSAESRLTLWSNCLDCMGSNPLLGLGPRNFPLVAPRYGHPLGKEAHTTWLQLGAEQGGVGLALLLLFYGGCMWRLWRVLRQPEGEVNPALRPFAYMVIASTVGFMVSAQFVTLLALEVPYYVVMVGAGVLKLA